MILLLWLFFVCINGEAPPTMCVVGAQNTGTYNPDIINGRYYLSPNALEYEKSGTEASRIVESSSNGWVVQIYISAGSYLWSYVGEVQALPHQVTAWTPVTAGNPGWGGTLSVDVCSICDDLVSGVLHIQESSPTLDVTDCRTNILSVTIAADVTSLSAGVFEQCTHLESITFIGTPAIQTLPNSFCKHCNKLISFDVPSSVTTIEEYAFYQTSELKTVSIPLGVTIDATAFQESGCDEDLYVSGASLIDCALSTTKPSRTRPLPKNRLPLMEYILIVFFGIMMIYLVVMLFERIRSP